MSLHRSLALGFWLLAGLGAYAVAGPWADQAHAGKIHPWALIALFWGTAAVSAAIHYLARWLSRAIADGAEGLKRTWPYMLAAVRQRLQGRGAFRARAAHRG